LGLGVWFVVRWWRKREALFDNPWLVRAIALAGPLGFIALEAGWIVTEAGRQPWVINGYLKTADAVTPFRDVQPFLIGFVAPVRAAGRDGGGPAAAEQT